MEYNYVQYQRAVQKALKEFEKVQSNKKGKKMAKDPIAKAPQWLIDKATAPMTTYPKGKKPKKK